MIAAFLPPYPFRGLPAPYLWVFYRLLHSTREPMAFLLSDDYLKSPDQLAAKGRWELDGQRQTALGYTLPDAEALSRHIFRLMDAGLMAALLPRYRGNPLRFFEAFLSERIPELEHAISAHLASLPERPELILSWCNCPSLDSAARTHGVRVAYLEMGPLRSPGYRSTAYFDFSGVNGNTEAKDRFVALGGAFSPDVPLAVLRDSMTMESPPVAWVQPDARRHGVVLQVEDDSNLLCYGNGYDNTSVIARALVTRPAGDLLVRTHPGSRFMLRDPELRIDQSASSAEFVQQCASVTTINSSVGLEALLFDTPVEALGDSSYAFIASIDDATERARCLAFYLFAYLVPFDLVFDPEYIRFRLRAPSEAEILRKHLSCYMDHDGISRTELDGVSDLRSLVHSFVGRFHGAEARIRRFTHPASGTSSVAKLYYRSGDEHFSEGRVVECPVAQEAGQSVVRFMLPQGVQPSAIRFDPAPLNGVYVISMARWGRVSELGGTSDPTPHQLLDLATRVISSGDRQFSEPGRMPLKIIASSDDPFVELGVDDLWKNEGDATGIAALEFRFSMSEGTIETIFSLADITERLGAVGSHVASLRDSLGEPGNEGGAIHRLGTQLSDIRMQMPTREIVDHQLMVNGRIDLIDARLERLDEAMAREDAHIRQMNQSVDILVNRATRLKRFFLRLFGRGH